MSHTEGVAADKFSWVNEPTLTVEDRLAQAVVLGYTMLGIEARSWREQQQPKKAEAIEGAMKTMKKALDAYEAR